MGILYTSKEKHTKYFHHGYMLDSRICTNDDLELFTCVFLRKREKRLVRKVTKNMVHGATLDNLLKLRTLTYEKNCTIPKYILKTYNIYVDKNFAYVISEPCTGGFLFDILRNNDEIISEKLLAEWFYQIIVALHFLEQNNIYHGNLNGYCVFFKDSRKEEIRLSLLSKNKKYDNIDNKGDLYGLHFIRSPQEIRKLYHDKNNTWYIGILLYFLLHGSYPFMNNSVLINYLNIVQEDIPFAHLKSQHSHLSANIYDFLKKTLEKNYDERPSTRELLAHAWIRDREKHPTNNIVGEKTRRSACEQIKTLENRILSVEEDDD
ncbi:protein kinase, putative [Plasmodium ovale wallikeri]|uniref:Protein kinase, putative n=2 Tax=Plasmodium ovale TaxID=36330 RepID=A0A1A8YSV9_PLAOA|nr:protein kinase, putative [Plasmodium ovale wallikeri]SBT34724.1 protein kinase, putative [Plasmodium ovale wallikeri]SBT76754.1 protein kinase, putative [Plasmodium ovale]